MDPTAFQTVVAERTARDRKKNLRQRTSVTNYASQFTGLLLQVPEMHPKDAVYRFARGLDPPDSLPRGPSSASSVDNAIRLAQAADSALHFTAAHLLCQPANTFSYMGPQPMQLGALTKLSPAARDRLFGEIRCLRCRQPGHRALKCNSFNTMRSFYVTNPKPSWPALTSRRLAQSCTRSKATSELPQ